MVVVTKGLLLSLTNNCKQIQKFTAEKNCFGQKRIFLLVWLKIHSSPHSLNEFLPDNTDAQNTIKLKLFGGTT